MSKQSDGVPCHKTGCAGVMTYHEKLKIDDVVGVVPSGMVGGRPDHHFSGWLCDACREVLWDKP